MSTMCKDEFCDDFFYKIAWMDDPHYFAHFVRENGEKVNVQKYSKTYTPVYLDKIDLITPSPVYFKNLNINMYNDKIYFLFYMLNPCHYKKIKIDNYNERKNNIILSGCMGSESTYKTRYQFKMLKYKSKEFDDLIYWQKTPGYSNNEHMTEMNYYNKLSEFKGAFVGHHVYPINFLLAKHIEILMCGCLGFFERNNLLYEELGLIEFVHYIPCTDENGDVIDDYEYYAEWLNNKKGAEIALNGSSYVRKTFGESHINNYIETFKGIIKKYETNDVSV